MGDSCRERNRRIIRSVEIGRCGVRRMRQGYFCGRYNGFESVIKRGSVCVQLCKDTHTYRVWRNKNLTSWRWIEFSQSGIQYVLSTSYVICIS